MQKYLQIIFLAVDGRIAKFLIIIPAYDITPLGGYVAESYTVISDLGREEIESPIFVPELFEYVIRRPDIPFEQIWDIFLQIRRGIQGYAVLQDLGQIVACGDNVRKIAAGQSGFILLRCYVRKIDFHAYLFRQILPHAKIRVVAVARALGRIRDRQDDTFFGGDRTGQERQNQYDG